MRNDTLGPCTALFDPLTLKWSKAKDGRIETVGGKLIRFSGGKRILHFGGDEYSTASNEEATDAIYEFIDNEWKLWDKKLPFKLGIKDAFVPIDDESYCT